MRPALAPPPPRAARLFGRARVLAEIREAAQPLTLVGPSGVGKTEIALHVLATAEGDDHIFVDLTHARDVDEVLAAIAATLDVRAQRDMITALRASISARNGLFVLDRCERAADGVAEIVRALQVPMLCTATAPLRYPGEVVTVVEPLEDDAIALFHARSPMVRDPSTRERALIEELCAIAGGVPLAIELIASRDEAPLQLVRELDARADRNGIVRSVAAWSIDRLDAMSRLALAQAAVIEGPFDTDTFESIVDLPSDVAPLDVLSTLASLALVGRAPRAEARFVIAPAVRHVALELLADRERLRALRRHASYFAARLTKRHDVVERSRERSDLLVAHELALVDEEVPAETAVALAEAIVPALLRHGPLEAALAVAEATRARAPSPLLQVLAARAEVALGRDVAVVLAPATPELALAIGELCLEQGEHRAAVSMLTDAARDPALAADANRLLADAHVDEPALALRAIERAGVSGPLLARRAAIHLELGDPARARVDAMEALTQLVDGRDVRASALALITLADAQEEEGIPSTDTLASARQLAQRAGDLALLGRVDALEATRALARGDLATADSILARVPGQLGAALREHVGALRSCRTVEPPPAIARLARRARATTTIARDGSRAVLPEGAIALEKRPILRRLLSAFVTARVEAPGKPLAIADLFTAGWPGERVAPNVQSDRVHASLQALRDLGLRGYIVTLSGGWALDPDRAFNVTPNVTPGP